MQIIANKNIQRKNMKFKNAINTHCLHIHSNPNPGPNSVQLLRPQRPNSRDSPQAEIYDITLRL